MPQDGERPAAARGGLPEVSERLLHFDYLGKIKNAIAGVEEVAVTAGVAQFCLVNAEVVCTRTLAGKDGGDVPCFQLSTRLLPALNICNIQQCP